MNDNRNKKDTDQLRSAFSGTKEQASDNLKYRIMQQIATESALSRKNAKGKSSVFSALFPILGVMYGVVGVVLLVVYLLYGFGAFSLSSVYIPLICVVSVFSVYLFISAFDEKRRVELKSKKERENL